MKHCLLFTLLNILTAFSYGQDYTSGRRMQLQMVTDKEEYEFISNDMDGRLNDVQQRFEFIIPVNSMKSLKYSSDLDFFKNFMKGNETIMIYVFLPEDKNPDLDFSFFKGNKSITLAAEIKIGTLSIRNEIDFNGMLMNGDQSMAFNFFITLNEKELSFTKVGKEKILKLEITARGDRITGLTLVK